MPDARQQYIDSLGTAERDPGRLDRLKSLWDLIARQYAGKPGAVDLKGYDPMAAFAALGGGNAWGNPRSDILKFLQLGNEIGAEQGRGRDTQVMQLIAALLGGRQQR